MKKTIERKFHPRFEGILQFVVNYEDFQKLDIGDCLGILAQGRGNKFSAYFEGREVYKRHQIILLQQEENLNDGPIIDKKTSKVVEYKLPLSGKINIKDFYKGKVKEYHV